MAPSSGQVLVPKVFKALRLAISKTASLVRSRRPQASAANLEPVPALLRRQPLHPIAALRQHRSQQRYFTTAARSILSLSPKAASAARVLPTSTVRTALSKTTHAPFSSPLRPNLTGGTLPRSAGGYSLGGTGVRHFSHIPATQAQVVNNVSTAVRAFWLNGYKAKYDGIDPRTGEKRFSAVTVNQEKALAGLRHAADILNARGTTLEFHIAPTVTAISPLSTEQTLGSSAILQTLASDFSRSLSSLSLIHADLKRLATLGPLPISHPTASIIHVRFPGCDARIVTALCDELDIQRGIIREDEAWAEEGGDKDVGMALLFPWVPGTSEGSYPGESDVEDAGAMPYFQQYTTSGTQSLDWRSMLSDGPPFPPREASGSQDCDLWPLTDVGEGDEKGSESFDAVRSSDLASNESFGMDLRRTETLRGYEGRGRERQNRLSGKGYEGVEGIYRFLAECEAVGQR